MSDTAHFAEYINSREDLSPDGLHASLSYHMFAFARSAIIKFFEDPTISIMNYGWSSGNMRGHMLYRHTDGIIYVIHQSYGDLSDAFYFTRGEMEGYFEDFESEMPDFTDPAVALA